MRNEFATKFVNNFHRLASLGFEIETKLRAAGTCCLSLITYISRGLGKGGSGPSEPGPGGKRPLPFPQSPASSAGMRSCPAAWCTARPLPAHCRLLLLLPSLPVPAICIIIVYFLVGMAEKGRVHDVFLNIYDF